MDKFDRIYDLHQIFAGRRIPLPVEALMERLGCSKPSVYRLIRLLRDRLNAPIEFDRERGGYLYRQDAATGPYELPGLRYSASELQALIVFERLLEFLQSGLLAEHLRPLAVRVTALVAHRRLGLSEAAAQAIEAGRPAVSPNVDLELPLLHEIGRIVKGTEPILSALGRDIGLQIEAAGFPRVAAAARSLGWTRDRVQVRRDAMDAGQRFRGAGQRALYAEAVNWYDAAFLMGHRGKI